MHPPFGEIPAAAGTGILAPGCPVRAIGHGAPYCVYDVAGGLRVLTPRQHTYPGVLGLFAMHQKWLVRLWPPAKRGGLRAFDAKRAAADLVGAARGADAAVAARYREGRGEIAAFCPVRSLGQTPGRDGMFPVCIYAVAGVGLYAIGASRHNRLAIQGLFAAYPEWLERLWPLPPDRRHRWDAWAAAGDLLAASVRCSYGEPQPPPPRPSAEIVRLRPLPPPPCGRL